MTSQCLQPCGLALVGPGLGAWGCLFWGAVGVLNGYSTGRCHFKSWVWDLTPCIIFMLSKDTYIIIHNHTYINAYRETDIHTYITCLNGWNWAPRLGHVATRCHQECRVCCGHMKCLPFARVASIPRGPLWRVAYIHALTCFLFVDVH